MVSRQVEKMKTFSRPPFEMPEIRCKLPSLNDRRKTISLKVSLPEKKEDELSFPKGEKVDEITMISKNIGISGVQAARNLESLERN